MSESKAKPPCSVDERMPDEILIQVLFDVIQIEVDVWRSLQSLARVSKRWYGLVRSEARLWSRLQNYIPRDKIDGFIQRSGSHPLAVEYVTLYHGRHEHIDGGLWNDSAPVEDFFKRIIGTSARWTSIKLITRSKYLIKKPSHLTNQFSSTPNLREVYIEDSYQTPAWCPLSSMSILHLTIVSCGPPYWQPGSLPQLQTLKLHMQEAGLLHSKILAILDASPRLEVLEVFQKRQGPERYGMPPGPLPIASRLRVIRLRKVSGVIVDTLLEAVDVTNLSELSLDYEPPNVDDSLEHLRPTLQNSDGFTVQIGQPPDVYGRVVFTAFTTPRPRGFGIRWENGTVECNYTRRINAPVKQFNQLVKLIQLDEASIPLTLDFDFEDGHDDLKFRAINVSNFRQPTHIVCNTCLLWDMFSRVGPEERDGGLHWPLPGLRSIDASNCYTWEIFYQLLETRWRSPSDDLAKLEEVTLRAGSEDRRKSILALVPDCNVHIRT